MTYAWGRVQVVWSLPPEQRSLRPRWEPSEVRSSKGSLVETSQPQPQHPILLFLQRDWGLEQSSVSLFHPQLVSHECARASYLLHHLKSSLLLVPHTPEKDSTNEARLRVLREGAPGPRRALGRGWHGIGWKDPSDLAHTPPALHFHSTSSHLPVTPRTTPGHEMPHPHHSCPFSLPFT